MAKIKKTYIFLVKKLLRILLLWPISIVYWLVTTVRNLLYSLHVLPQHRVKAKVISIGNLSMGGTGKTTVAEFFIRVMTERGYKVAYLSRGYGRQTTGYLKVDPALHTYKEVGDEALQVASKYPGVPIAVCEDRVEGAQRLIDDYGVNLIILDDAFQHRRIYRDMDVVVIPYGEDPWRDYVIPMGNLRESYRNIRRADLVLVTKCPGAKEAQEMAQQMKKRRIYAKVVFMGLEVTTVKQFSPQEAEHPITGFHQVGAILFSALGNNDQFFNFARRMGLFPVRNYGFRDHRPYSERDFNRMIAQYNRAVHYQYMEKGTVLVTTEKDYYRLKNSSWFAEKFGQYPFYYLSVSLMPLHRNDRLDEKIRNLFPKLTHESHSV